jgi:8-oxo-dGTP diphosphatase
LLRVAKRAAEPDRDPSGYGPSVHRVMAITPLGIRITYKELGKMGTDVEMAKSSKLLVIRGSRVLLVRRKRDGRWTFPGGKRKEPGENAERCLKRELAEELPGLRCRGAKLWRKVKGTNPETGRRVDHMIFTAKNVSGALVIGDQGELDKAAWRKPWSVRLAPNTRFVRDLLLPRRAAFR